MKLCFVWPRPQEEAARVGPASGGYAYDQALVAALRRRQVEVSVVEVRAALEPAEVADATAVVVDALGAAQALPALAAVRALKVGLFHLAPPPSPQAQRFLDALDVALFVSASALEETRAAHRLPARVAVAAPGIDHFPRPLSRPPGAEPGGPRLHGRFDSALGQASPRDAGSAEPGSGPRSPRAEPRGLGLHGRFDSAHQDRTSSEARSSQPSRRDAGSAEPGSGPRSPRAESRGPSIHGRVASAHQERGPSEARSRDAGGAAPAPPPHLLAVAHVLRHKGALEALEVLAALRDLAPHLAWTATWLGGLEVDRAYAREVLQRRDALGLSERVDFAGRVPPSRVADELARSAALLSTSVSESWGLAAAEALSYGVPLVSWTRGGVFEPAAAAGAGAFLAPGDVRGMAAALERLLVDAPRRARAEEAALAFGASLPTWDDCAHAVIHACA